MCRRNRQLTVCVLKVEGSSTPGHLIVTATPLEQGSDKISVMQDDLVGGTDGRVQKIERKVVNRPAFVRLQNIETRADDGSGTYCCALRRQYPPQVAVDAWAIQTMGNRQLARQRWQCPDSQRSARRA